MGNSWLKTSWLGKILLLFNLVLAGLLGASLLAPLVAPDQFWPLAFAGLAYPYFLVINMGFMVLWIFRKKIYFLVSLTVILLGYNHIGNTFQLSQRQDASPEDQLSLKVLSYNVRVFDLYNYKPDWTPRFTNRNNIFSFFQQEDFDIICLQEFVHDRSGVFKTLDTIPKIIRARYAHFEYSRNSKNINFFGLATFSAHPIIHKGKITFKSKGGNLCIYSDIKIGQDTIRVYNVHFESIGLGPEDYLFVDGILNPKDQSEIGAGSRRIMRRLKDAFILRGQQARIVSAHIAQSPYPVILAGDFNDTPMSYVYHEAGKHLEDAFKSGRGFGQTYIGAFPSFRIDYILHSPEFYSTGFTTGNQRYSDHFPVYTTLVKP